MILYVAGEYRVAPARTLGESREVLQVWKKRYIEECLLIGPPGPDPAGP